MHCRLGIIGLWNQLPKGGGDKVWVGCSDEYGCMGCWHLWKGAVEA
jgi:hypothetical protein